jgi:hypothetical protein
MRVLSWTCGVLPRVLTPEHRAWDDEHVVLDREIDELITCQSVGRLSPQVERAIKREAVARICQEVDAQ